MFRTERFLKVCLVLAACVGSGIGCGGDEKPPTLESAPFEGVRLQIAVPAGYNLQTSWRIELDEWSARTGATYELHEYEADDGNSAPTHRNKSSAAAANATLVVFPITEIATRQLAPIPDDLQLALKLHFTDLFAGLREGPASVAGKPTLLPISSPVLVYYYRRDVFTAADLSPPETWEQYLKLLGDLDARGLVSVSPWNEEFRTTMFLARGVTYAKHPHQFSLFFDVETGQPLIDGPGFVRALEESRPALNLMRKRTDVLKLSPADCRQMLLSGTAVAAISFETETSDSELERPASANIGCVRLPGNPTAYNRSTAEWETLRDEPVNRCTLTAFAGLCAGVSANSSQLQQRAAWELLAQIAVETRKLTHVFPPETRSLCRESQLAMPDAWTRGELSSAEADQVVKAIATSLRDTRLVAELPVVGRARFRAALSKGIGRFLADEVTAEAALKQVADEWQSITADIGAETVLNGYRRSIGLSLRRKR
jgi:ABC-type glycerol-3-phosphate transport system substrate-binding protein